MGLGGSPKTGGHVRQYLFHLDLCLSACCEGLVGKRELDGLLYYSCSECLGKGLNSAHQRCTILARTWVSLLEEP